MDFNWQIESPACIMLSGASGCGKTELTKKILQRANELFDKPVHRVVWCYSEFQGPLLEELKATVPNIEFHKGLIEDFESPDPSQHSVLVLDDMLHEVGNKNMQSLFVRGSHHQNCSIIYLTQSCFAPGQRTISLQMKYIALMRNPRENSNYQYLGRQMNGGKNCPALDAAYHDICNKPYAYMVVDYGQKQDDKFRIRSSFFPEDMTVYSKK